MDVNKDWTGNRNSIYTTLGASNHSDKERQNNDYYATEPKATELLLAEETFAPVIWECACGEGHMAKVLEEKGYQVISTDLIYRGYGNEKPVDFLQEPVAEFDGDIITNPPKTVYVSSSRLICAMNGEFEKYPSSAVAYAWFVWEKGYKGNPEIKWIN